jgi:hypothetical protein
MDPDLNQKLAAYGMRLEFWKVSDLQKLAEKTKNPSIEYLLSRPFLKRIRPLRSNTSSTISNVRSADL